jgi:LuxR family maltose regulon positive regulatory protein
MSRPANQAAQLKPPQPVKPPPAMEGRSVAFAKTTRPQLGAIIARERLFQRMNGTPGHRLVWICGPPGAGKTSLAASFVESRQRRCLWYEIDADDADVATFFHYFCHAAMRLDGARIGALPAYAPEFASRLPSFARRFFRQALSAAKSPLAVVLDGVGPLPEGSDLLLVLEAAVSQVPSGGCVIVTSRFDAPPSFARLQATGEMAVIDASMLNVEPGELEQIATLRGQPLAPEACAQLHQRTGGWAAGLVLMLEHAKLSGALPDWPAESTPRVVFDFLAGEIFERFDQKMQRFLLKLACLPRVSAEIAQQLTGEDKAARLLLNLALNNYFVSEARWQDGRGFQFHPLMRDFLQHRAALDFPQALEAAHLRLAASLLREAGHAEDAASLLMRCRDWAALAALAAAQAEAMLAQGRGEQLALWLEALPSAELEPRPELLLAYALSRSGASPRAARRQFERAFEAFGRAADGAGQLRCAIGVIDALIDEFDDLAALDGWTERGALLRAQAGAGVDAGLLDLSAQAVARAWLLRPGSHAAAPPADAGQGVLPDWIRASIALWQGEVGQAQALLAATRPGDAGAGRDSRLRCAVASALASLVGGQLVLAAQQAGDGLRLAESEGRPGYDAFLHALAACAALAAGDQDGARAHVQWFDGQAQALRRGDRAIQHGLRCWLARLDGDLASAQREARGAATLAAEVGLPWLEVLARGALAPLLAQAQDTRGAQAQLRAAEALLPEGNVPLPRYLLLLAQAGVARALGREADALPALEQAFALGQSHGLALSPGWPASDLADLCALALAHDVGTGHARRLVREGRLVPRQAPLRVKDWPWPIRIQTLGRFDITVSDAPVEFSGKGPGRPAELLKLLLSLGAQGVRLYQLSDALWPHVDADYAHKSFTAALHRLRRLLGNDEALLLRDARLSLNQGVVWTDLAALEQALSEIEDSTRLPVSAQASGPGQARAPGAALHTCVLQALDLYRGPFLPDESDQPGYIACREQLRARLLRGVARAARHWEEAGRFDVAADFYLQLIQSDSLFEAPYRNLMLCHQRHGDLAAAREVYERLRATFALRLKVMPSAQAQAVYAALDGPAP